MFEKVSEAVCSVNVVEQYSDLTDSQLVAVIDAALDALTTRGPDLSNDRDRLAVFAAAIRTQGRLQTFIHTRAAQLDTGEVAQRAHGTSLTTWAITTLTHTHREAATLVKAGEQLGRFPTITNAAQAGAVSPAQADAITQVLTDLPDDLPASTLAQGEQLMLDFAATFNSTELRRLAHHLLECLAPEVADQKEADRLERDHRHAQRTRHLTFTPDHHGSVFLKGSLPSPDAATLIALIDSYVTAQRGIDRLDPRTPTPTPGMRRADALMALVHAHSQAETAPKRAGDRPRATITLDYATLEATAKQLGLLQGRLGPTNEPIPGSVLRRLLCDADILPIILGSDGIPLDVGRTQRLVTPTIRAALDQRDQGCVFPGCDKPPTNCHAHHIQPWWNGGTTALHNLVLLCPHHHSLTEPSHHPNTDRWHIHLNGPTPTITPPRHVDPTQTPRIHNRFHNPTQRN